MLSSLFGDEFDPSSSLQETSQVHFRVVFRAERAVVWHRTKIVRVHHEPDHAGVYLHEQVGSRSQSSLGCLSPTGNQDHSIGLPRPASSPRH